MTNLYKRHEVNTLAEVDALALVNGEENGAYVLSEYGGLCNYVTFPDGDSWWSYDDSMGGSHLYDGESVTVLVPIEAEEEYVAPDAITYSRYVTAWEEA